MQESASVGVRVTCRNQFTITLVQPDFDPVFTGLFEIVALQVVDDGQVVDKSAIRRDISVMIVGVFLTELSNQDLCNKKQQDYFNLKLQYKDLYKLSGVIASFDFGS